MISTRSKSKRELCRSPRVSRSFISRPRAFISTCRLMQFSSTPRWVDFDDKTVLTQQGDWKLSGLNLTTPLTQPDGSPTKYQFPEVDTRVPPQVQWKFDYLGGLIVDFAATLTLSTRICSRFTTQSGQRPVLARLCSLRGAHGRSCAIQQPGLCTESARECRGSSDEERVCAWTAVGALQQRAER